MASTIRALSRWHLPCLAPHNYLSTLEGILSASICRLSRYTYNGRTTSLWLLCSLNQCNGPTPSNYASAVLANCFDLLIFSALLYALAIYRTLVIYHYFLYILPVFIAHHCGDLDCHQANLLHAVGSRAVEIHQRDSLLRTSELLLDSKRTIDLRKRRQKYRSLCVQL